jgi:inosine/xanthosine triphosphatase
MNIVVATENSGKIQSSRLGFQDAFNWSGFKISGMRSESGVSHQPKGDQETYAGAQNRIRFIADKVNHADFIVAIEGGVKKLPGKSFYMVTVVACVRTKAGKFYFGEGPAHPLPESFTSGLDRGLELDDVFKEIYGELPGKERGVTGYFFSDINRVELSRAAVRMAFGVIKADI